MLRRIFVIIVLIIIYLQQQYCFIVWNLHDNFYDKYKKVAQTGFCLIAQNVA